MAKPVSEEELQLKKRARRRLIGAIALVATVAVVLPMVLDSDPKPTSREVNIQIPSPDSKGFASKVVPLVPKSTGAEGKAEKADKSAKAPEKSAETAAEPAAPAVAEKAPAKAPEKAAEKTAAPEKAPDKAPAKAAEKAAEKPADKPVEKAPQKAVEKAAAPVLKPGTFYIQVTALADPERAKSVQQRIIDAGFPAFIQTIPAGKGDVTRVRAGPFTARADADKAQAALQGLGLEGKVAEVK